ncbi:alkane 1-monooxygenase [Nocardia stercoris]|uniref:Alkane 1-monooxygenase n=1 Tax=Nocardia stercoris TaxID=2483361 RepID=A0A3M2LBY7_9NOCA|nr:alkane 1-monooxygenase [Nocardia stercoris]RMI35037.1 alkane 1-monooxygenase [Nocardia stercoris]
MVSDVQPAAAARPKYRWRRYIWLAALFEPASLFLVVLPLVRYCHHTGFALGAHVAFWFGPIAVHVLLPIADFVVPPDDRNPEDSIIEYLAGDPYYRAVTMLCLPLQLASIVTACYLWTSDAPAPVGQRIPLTAVDKVGLAFTIGLVGGIAITAGHELGHKKVELERWLGKVMLSQVCYGQFFIEHNRGHHVRVGTLEDPASARFGESMWRFGIRFGFDSLWSAFRLEAERLRKAGHGPWSPRNDMITTSLMSVALFGILATVFGIEVLPYLALQAFYACFMLMMIAYTQHYGLGRKRTASGRYERATPADCWDSNRTLTNLALFNVQRHGDHHINPTNRYQAQRLVDGPAMMPTGYTGMMLLAAVPPLWRRVIDPLVLAHIGGDLERLNIEPAKRDRVLASLRRRGLLEPGSPA